MKIKLRDIGVFIYGIILSSVIGIVSFIFLKIESQGAQILWSLVDPDNSLRLWYIFGVTVSGGLLLGMAHKKWGPLPVIAHDAISELKRTGTADYRNVFKSLAVALLVLIFGAGVGPEAALLGAIVLLSVWQSDKLRYYYYNYKELHELRMLERLKRLAHPTNYLSTYNKERTENENIKTKKKLFNVLFVFNGLLTFRFLMKLVDAPSFITKMGVFTWHLKELWLAIPLVLSGLLYGQLFNLIKTLINKYLTLWAEFPIRRALLGSFFIFVIGIFLPNLLFSGQTSLALIPILAKQSTFFTLSLLALIKLVFLQVCLTTGWIGGDIFPVTFAAIIQGFALAQLFPQIDCLLIVATVSTSMAISILKQPILVGIFMMLFFPLNLAPIILGIALASHLGKSALKQGKI